MKEGGSGPLGEAYEPSGRVRMPFRGVFDWEGAFLQNPGEERYEVDTWMQIMNHGAETAQQAQERAARIARRRRRPGSNSEPFAAVSV